MSFICHTCGIPVIGLGPVVKVLTRPATYFGKTVHEKTGEESVVQVGVGFETDKEVWECPVCSNTTPVREAQPDFTKLSLLAQGYHTHVYGCEGMKTKKVVTADGVEKVRVPCETCERIKEIFAGYPLSALAVALEDSVAAPLKTPVASLALDRLITRTNHHTYRGSQDVIEASTVLTSFAKRNLRAQ